MWREKKGACSQADSRISIQLSSPHHSACLLARSPAQPVSTPRGARSRERHRCGGQGPCSGRRGVAKWSDRPPSASLGGDEGRPGDRPRCPFCSIVTSPQADEDGELLLAATTSAGKDGVGDQDAVAHAEEVLGGEACVCFAVVDLRFVGRRRGEVDSSFVGEVSDMADDKGEHGGLFFLKDRSKESLFLHAKDRVGLFSLLFLLGGAPLPPTPQG